jgi:hypothetical protein
MSKTQTLSKSMLAAFNEFDRAAQAWGWQEDQGSGDTVATAEERYRAARKGLYDKILQQQKRLKAASKARMPK